MMRHCGLPIARTRLTDINKQDIQPNAVDLRLDKVFGIDCNEFELSEDHKKHRGTYEIKTMEDGFYYLVPGHYEVVMENIITVAPQQAGWVITRSTLNRNGVFLTSGLYDSGYNGVMAAVMHVTVGPAKIKRGTRIGQYLSFDSEMYDLYQGSYGLHSEHDKKYGV